MSPNPQTNSESTALITGASSGIGLEMARIFARSRHNLVLVARNEAQRTSLAGELTEQLCLQKRA